ncbi:hydroxyphenylacetyl-CoA thioesterase PaaI [Bradyrhizobium sp. 2TAF24]|uniref:hydroxyphenylacetyl-CoA thioesterase PaaI n=1 Tax=Bradyrhizobium sp. 2TAF24 TaxID=3233011 RepID=UPI003F92DF76
MDTRNPAGEAKLLDEARAMWAQDRASQGLGMVLAHSAIGEAIMTMKVRPDMVNGHRICHGGFVFTLADSAFAFACNSYGEPTVAQQCAVTFIRPVPEGETLTAHAVERSRVGRGGIYDVTVRDSHGAVVAEFRGHSRTFTPRGDSATRA